MKQQQLPALIAALHWLGAQSTATARHISVATEFYAV